MVIKMTRIFIFHKAASNGILCDVDLAIISFTEDWMICTIMTHKPLALCWRPTIFRELDVRWVRQRVCSTKFAAIAVCYITNRQHTKPWNFVQIHRWADQKSEKPLNRTFDQIAVLLEANSWTEVSLSGTAPTGLYHATLVWSPTDKRIYLFGGTTSWESWKNQICENISWYHEKRLTLEQVFSLKRCTVD